ncbi:hypothetical protein [Streptomyces anandii]|uniref:hypothetical protein n=1 Tax=Streptomyces anandii TaxID=285454 RepID=UPI0037883422
MTRRLARARAALYTLASVWSAFCALQQARYGAFWAVPVFALASLVPILALAVDLALVDELGRLRAALAADERLPHRLQLEARGRRRSVDQ